MKMTNNYKVTTNLFEARNFQISTRTYSPPPIKPYALRSIRSKQFKIQIALFPHWALTSRPYTDLVSIQARLVMGTFGHIAMEEEGKGLHGAISL